MTNIRIMDSPHIDETFTDDPLTSHFCLLSV